MSLRFVDLAAQVAVKYSPVTRRKHVDAALTLLPPGGRAEQIAVPRLIEQRFAVVVPGSIDHPRGAESLAVAHETLDVDDCVGVVGIDSIPAAHAGRDPGFHSDVAKWLDESDVRGISPVSPWNRDEIFRNGVHQLGRAEGDVAPEQELLPTRTEHVDDLPQKIEIHDADSRRLHSLGGLTATELERFVGAEVDEAARKERIDLGEHLPDQRKRAWLPRREHVSVRR